MQTTARKNIDVYTQVNKYSGVTDASPHRLVEMLLEGALEKLAKAKYFLKRGELVTKGDASGQPRSQAALRELARRAMEWGRPLRFGEWDWTPRPGRWAADVM